MQWTRGEPNVVEATPRPDGAPASRAIATARRGGSPTSCARTRNRALSSCVLGLGSLVPDEFARAPSLAASCGRVGRVCAERLGGQGFAELEGVGFAEERAD